MLTDFCTDLMILLACTFIGTPILMLLAEYVIAPIAFALIERNNKGE